MWGKCIVPQQKKLLPFLPASLLNAEVLPAKARWPSFGILLICFRQGNIWTEAHMCFWFRLDYQPLFGKMWQKLSLLLIWIQEESESMSVSGNDALNTLVTSPHLEKMKSWFWRKFFNCSSPAVTHLSLCYTWKFPNSACYHWLLQGHMKSNNETVSCQNLGVGNIAKSMKSEGNSTLLPANVDQWLLSQLGLVDLQLYNKSLKDWPLGQQLILFPSIFPSATLRFWGNKINSFPWDQS